MKKAQFFIAAAACAMLAWGCGPSAEEQEKQKQEILQTEAATTSVDSTAKEVAKTSGELDSLLNQLNAQ